jgi:hypothetical protein
VKDHCPTEDERKIIVLFLFGIGALFGFALGFITGKEKP